IYGSAPLPRPGVKLPTGTPTIPRSQAPAPIEKRPAVTVPQGESEAGDSGEPSDSGEPADPNDATEVSESPDPA
ncbi:MAG: hypothetical protein ACKOJF_34680, partial [Planctomycetaceae bacterium]